MKKALIISALVVGGLVLMLIYVILTFIVAIVTGGGPIIYGLLLLLGIALFNKLRMICCKRVSLNSFAVTSLSMLPISLVGGGFFALMYFHWGRRPTFGRSSGPFGGTDWGCILSAVFGVTPVIITLGVFICIAVEHFSHQKNKDNTEV